MKKQTKKYTAKVLTIIILFITALSFPINHPSTAKAAHLLPSSLSLELNKKYSGSVQALYDQSIDAWSVRYFNVETEYKPDDFFLISFEIEGIDDFTSVTMQNSADNGNESILPNTYHDYRSRFFNVIQATEDNRGDNNPTLSFRLNFEGNTNNIPDSVMITLTDLRIISVTDHVAGYGVNNWIPPSKYLDYETFYSDSVYPELTDYDQYTVEYFTVNDSSYEIGDQFLIFCRVSGANIFRQVAIMSSLSDWSWDRSPQIWINGGIPNGQLVGGLVEACSAGDFINFSIRFHYPITPIPYFNIPYVDINDLIIIPV